jgi:hypothetical protein
MMSSSLPDFHYLWRFTACLFGYHHDISSAAAWSSWTSVGQNWASGTVRWSFHPYFFGEGILIFSYNKLANNTFQLVFSALQIKDKCLSITCYFTGLSYCKILTKWLHSCLLIGHLHGN